ncbi:MAG TPA: TraR/DksA C4-type zinc finger protein, partial [Chthoniobacteraceae bacterium]|nr:TraR/DksA C4-type zinc finger protein [Chthoniobacteraceae bacterium]
MAKAKPAKPAAKAKKHAKPKAKAAKPAKAAKAAKAPKHATHAKPARPAAKAGKASSKADNAKVNGANKAEHKPLPAKPKNGEKVALSPFLKKQQERLLQLRDSLLDAMAGVAKDNLRSRAEGSEASAFGMHQADAGSDAYDRDFALSLLSQEQDALYEIEEALKRIEQGTYGNCEMSGKPIAHARLEALPFARYTVECQSQLEKQNRV